MKLILVRHAQTDLNYEKRYQGKGSDDDLNEMGIMQAQKTAEYLKNERIDFVFSSPQKRALNTAKIINQYHNKKINVNENLSEKDFGKLEGMKYNEIDYKHIVQNDLHKQYEIEHENDVSKRIMEFFDKLHIECFGKTVLIVSHGGILKMLISVLRGIPWAKGIYEIKKTNSSVSIIEVDEKKQVKYMDIGRDKHLEM